MARRLGVRTPLEVNGAFPPAMGLGSVAVSPLDMASAYATLAAGGDLQRADRHPPRDPERQAGRPLGVASPSHPRHSGRRGIGRDRDPRGQRSLRDGHGRGALPPGRGQDRNHRQARRRLVRRLHAGPLHRRLDGLHARRDADDERPRHLRLGRLVPRGDLAPVHGSRSRGAARRATSPSRGSRSRSRRGTAGRSALSYDPYYVAPAAPETTTEETPAAPAPGKTAPKAKPPAAKPPAAGPADAGSSGSPGPASGGRPAEP